jgi:hypothetical protein
MTAESATTGAATTAELRKLAHTLGIPPARLAGLQDVPAEDLRLLRAQIGEALFRADRHFFLRIASLTRTVPSPVAAKLAEKALPPLLAARTTELLEPHKAVDMVGRLPDAYLADVAMALDPSRCTHVLQGMPADRAAEIGSVLAGRGEWVVIGGFVSYVSPEAVLATARALTGEQLLHVSFVIDDVDRVDEISQELTEAQVDDMVRAAYTNPSWAELAALVDNLRPARLARLGERFRAAGDDALAAARRAVEAGDLPAATLQRLIDA